MYFYVSNKQWMKRLGIARFSKYTDTPLIQVVWYLNNSMPALLYMYVYTPVGHTNVHTKGSLEYSAHVWKCMYVTVHVCMTQPITVLLNVHAAINRTCEY